MNTDRILVEKVLMIFGKGLYVFYGAIANFTMKLAMVSIK